MEIKSIHVCMEVESFAKAMEFYGPLFAAATVFFVPSFLMGMVSPYAVKLNATSLAALGGVAGPVLYRLVRAAGEGWRDYWQILAAAVTVAAIGAALAIDRRADAQARQPEPVDPTAAHGGWRVSAALRTPQFWIITAAYTAYLLCETSLNGLSAAHLTSRGMTPALAAAMLSLQALVNVAARAGAGWLADRIMDGEVLA